MIIADYNGLTQCINNIYTEPEDRFFALFILADTYEERGEDNLSQALRTLVREERYPGTIKNLDGTEIGRVWWSKQFHRHNWYIGETLYTALENAQYPCDDNMANYPTITDAYIALAKAMVKLGIETTIQ